MAKVKAWLDRNMGKFVSRKLAVWITSTVLLVQGHIPADDWVLLSAIWMGGQAVIDGVQKLKGLS